MFLWYERFGLCISFGVTFCSCLDLVLINLHISVGVVRVPLICMAYRIAYCIRCLSLHEKYGMEGVMARPHESMYM